MFLRTKDKYLPCIVFAAFLLRAVFALMYKHDLYPDEYSWNALSAALLSGEGFLNNMRPPGYIAMAAAVYKIFGAGNFTALRLTQALLGALQVAFVYFLTLKIFKKTLSARIAAGLAALYPYLIFFSARILSETLYSFLMTSAAFYIYSMADENDSLAHSIAAGVLVSLAALTKATILAVSPFLIVWFALNRIAPKKILFFFSAALLCVSPWILRNYHKYGGFVSVTPSGSYFFQAYNSETMRLETETRQLKEVRWYTDEYQEIAELPVLEADREYRRRALSFIRNNPLSSVKLMAMRFSHFWRLYPITNNVFQKSVAFATSGPVILFGLAGMILSISLWKKTLLLIGLIFTFNAVHTVFLCTLRYRIPIEPFFMIFAAFAVEKFIMSLKQRRLRKS
ncbi:MAG: hypothetical protein COS41_06065 [Elusimicrobia bacterium CG03_land_8_20_14_0_80_50_18]|nr:MAG: hypothetical protein COS41_06065 [Elusimicrobia bacterium CG03_land_8_20_14_0_80_50_18]